MQIFYTYEKYQVILLILHTDIFLKQFYEIPKRILQCL